MGIVRTECGDHMFLLQTVTLGLGFHHRRKTLTAAVRRARLQTPALLLALLFTWSQIQLNWSADQHTDLVLSRTASAQTITVDGI